MQIIGPTRSGKSQLLFSLAAQDMRRDMPVFFMEAKGDHSDFDQFLALAQRCDRGAQIRYFNPQDPRSMTFNPIRKLPGQDATALANQIARIIGREPTSSGEGQDYYRSVDYAKIQNMAEVFWSTGLEFTLRDCFLYFTEESCRELALRLCKDEKVAQTARQEIEKNPDTTALTSALRPWTTDRLGELLNTYSPEIVLEDIFDKGQLAYFAIPVGHLQVLANPLGRMLISGLLSVASWRQQSRVKPDPASVVLDEFAEFATPAFASFIATVGSARFWTTLSHQDLGQLKKVQGMDAEAFHSAVYNNTSGCKICFRTPDPEDAEFWSSTLGTYATTEDTERVQKWLLGTRRTGDMSRRGVEHFKIHPNKLKNLPPGAALVFSPGREDCLVRTARAYPLLKEKARDMVRPYAPARPGLHLEAAVRKPQEKDQAAKYDQRGARTR
jgi:type IV secretory pathway TraG/TraD family ATPase VirD4